jgi:hypothetical protein
MHYKAPFTIKLFLSTGILFLLMFIPLVIKAGNTPKSFYEGSIRLNPECKIKRMSNGEVIVIAKNQEGTTVNHKFTDFYADLLMAAYRKQRMEFIAETFSKKYFLSQDDCRREIKHAINVLVEWNIVLREDQIALK